MKVNALTVILALLGTCITTDILADPSSGIQIMDNIDGSQTLIGHVPMLVKQGQAVFKYHATQNITARIIMPLQNQSTLTGLIKGLNDPNSPNYHHFLTPPQFNQQFGSSSVNIQIIQNFLNKEGITVVGQSGGGTVLNVSGPVSAFENALGLHINYYQRNDGLMFFAPDADPTIPPTLAGKILAVGGLDNLPKYHSNLQQLVANSLPKATGTGPDGFLAPNDVKTAYNMNGISSNGLGQTIGLFELQGYSASDITAYETNFGVPAVPLQNFIIDGFSGVDYTQGADEVTLDIEIAAAMAPGSSINVYEAPNTTQSWMDEWTTIAANTNVTVISCSWGEPELDSPTLNFDNNIFQQMAAQGQAVFVAAGDNGAYESGGSTPDVDEPADQPFVTGVGISKLTTGTNGVYVSESASLDGGGGISAVWSIPDYQIAAASQANAAAKVSTTMRNIPDVALTADPSTGYAFYINGSWGGWWGSSIASPIWAAFMSRVDQGLGAYAPIGSVNTALYQIAQTGNYANDFHSITTGNNGYYPAEPGYNDATGLGSFNGLNLYNDLVNNAVSGTPPVIASQPVSVTVTAPATATFSVFATGTPAPSYQWKQSINGGTFTDISGATGSSYTTAATSAANNGTQYEVVVNNTSGSVTSNVVTLTVQGSQPVIVASPSSVNAGGTVTVTVSNGPGHTGDWVGLYPVGAASTAWVAWDYLNGAQVSPATGTSSATLTFTAPSTGGQYQLRLYLNNTNTLLATSNTVTVNAVTPTITVSPSTVNAGSTVTVTVSNGPGYTGDWVGLYPVGASASAWASWDYLNGTQVSPATGLSSATLTFTAPSTGGQYQLRLYLNNTNTLLATSNTVTVNAVTPTITASPSTVNGGSTITVTISNDPGNAGDWVGLYPVGAAANGWVAWDYLNGTQTSPATGTSSATLTFTAPSTGGQYQLRLYLNNTNTLLATSNTVTVNAVTPTITASPSTVNGGSTITVTISNDPGNAGDWVGLYPVGAAANGWVAWDYLNGTQTSPATGTSSATLTFTAPSTGGQYQLRLYLNNTNTLLATSNTVTGNAVTPTITVSPSTVNAGSTVTVTVSNGPGYTGDWVGLYPVGAASNAWVAWDYLNGTQVSPATGTSSATMSFTVPSTGQYELRLYQNNSNKLLATSNQVTSS